LSLCKVQETFGTIFVSAPECRDIETALYDRTYVFSVLCSIFQYIIKQWLRVLQLSGSRTHKSDEYIIRTMNIKHERCGMAFLLQAAHKIAVSCPKTLIVSCSGKWNRPCTLHRGSTR